MPSEQVYTCTHTHVHTHAEHTLRKDLRLHTVTIQPALFFPKRLFILDTYAVSGRSGPAFTPEKHRAPGFFLASWGQQERAG